MAESELFVAALPNWARSVSFSIQFKTTIFKSRSGHETRTAMKEFPSVFLEYEVTSTGSQVGRQFFARRLSEDVSFPDLFLKRTARSISSSSVSGDFNDHRFSVGRQVFLECESSGFHSGIVVSNNKTEMVFDSVLPMSSGERVKVYPELIGRIEGEIRSRQITSSVTGFTVSLKAHTDQGRVKDFMGWIPSQWYRDRPVVLWAPNWSGALTENWSRDQFSLDLGYGTPFYQAKRGHPERLSNYTTFLRSPEEAVEIVSFFCFCRGRQKSFYAPTWVDDFLFKSPSVEGQREIKVIGKEALDLYNRGGVFQSVAIRKKNTFHFSGILDFRPDGSDSILVLSDPIPASVAGSNRASWLLRQRFTSDRIDFEYVTDSVSEVEVKMSSVLEDYPVIRIGGIELTMDGKFVTLGSEREKAPDHALLQYGGFQISINGDYLL